jgi:ferric-dicitrate binding protein FerR (iron transport regulator)
MARFVRLTLADTQTPIVLNAQCVVGLRREGDARTVVLLQGESRRVVSESFEDVARRLQVRPIDAPSEPAGRVGPRTGP